MSAISAQPPFWRHTDRLFVSTVAAVMSLIAKLDPDCLSQSANTRSPRMVRNLNASRG